MPNWKAVCDGARPDSSTSAWRAATGWRSTSRSASRPWSPASVPPRQAACSCRSIPILKPDQVDVHLARLQRARPDHVGRQIRACSSRLWRGVRHSSRRLDRTERLAPNSGHAMLSWRNLLDAPGQPGHRVIDSDMAAILYTSGSTGKPKGVVLSHRNMVAGAKSVASYLDNRAERYLARRAALVVRRRLQPVDDGLSRRGARGAAQLPVAARRAEGVASASRSPASPPCRRSTSSSRSWTGPRRSATSLRYFANTGGRMPREILARLRRRVPRARPFLMYGLTEAFRSTYLPPEEVDRRPDSIGKAIPNAEILVLREDGTPCDVDEPGELVHRGALVGMGYWNDRREDRRALQAAARRRPGRDAGLPLPEYAVFSGDTVRRDGEGFLYFVGRRDEMIKTSGYRVSPTEVEEVLYATGRIGECAAFGVEHARLGQAIQVIATPAGETHRRHAPTCSPNAVPACRSTWCPRGSRSLPGRCRATPMARSTASSSPANGSKTCTGSRLAARVVPHLSSSHARRSPPRDAGTRSCADDPVQARRRRARDRGQPTDASRRSRRTDAVLCLRPRSAARAGRRAASRPAERRQAALRHEGQSPAGPGRASWRRWSTASTSRLPAS